MKLTNFNKLLLQQRATYTVPQPQYQPQDEPKGLTYMSALVIKRAVIKMSRGGYPVEFQVESADFDTGLTINEVETFIADCANNGYEPAYQFNKSEKKDLIGQRGMVKSVIATTSKKGFKLYEVTALLDDGGHEFKWNELLPSTFRMNDRIEVVKNERGFTVGQLLSEEAQKQETLPL